MTLGGCGTSVEDGAPTADETEPTPPAVHVTVKPGSGAQPVDIVKAAVERATQADTVKWHDVRGEISANIEVSPKDRVWYQHSPAGDRFDWMRTPKYELQRGDEIFVRIANSTGASWVTAETWIWMGPSIAGEGIPAVLNAARDYPIEVNLFPPESIASAEEVGTEVVEGQTLHKYAVAIDPDKHVENLIALAPSLPKDPTFQDEVAGIVPQGVHVWIDDSGELRQASGHHTHPEAGKFALDALVYNEPLSVPIPSESEI